MLFIPSFCIYYFTKSKFMREVADCQKGWNWPNGHNRPTSPSGTSWLNGPNGQIGPWANGIKCQWAKYGRQVRLCEIGQMDQLGPMCNRPIEADRPTRPKWANSAKWSPTRQHYATAPLKTTIHDVIVLGDNRVSEQRLQTGSLATEPSTREHARAVRELSSNTSSNASPAAADAHADRQPQVNDGSLVGSNGQIPRVDLCTVAAVINLDKRVR